MCGILGIGDAVVDIFRDRATAYPGGNALNVAVYSHLFFDTPAAFVGILGTDTYGGHVRSTLDQLGVDTALTRTVVGETGRTLVDVADDGDRVFVASNRGGVQAHLALRVDEADLELARRQGIVHTSIYSNIDHALPALAARARVSYDFSEKRQSLPDASLLSHLECAFFSASGWSHAERIGFAQGCIERGARVVVLTAGSDGAYGFTKDEMLFTPGIRMDVSDALGAGDGFIAGFLDMWQRTPNLRQALDAGAVGGARACGYSGAFGHGIAVPDEDMDRLIRGRAV